MDINVTNNNLLSQIEDEYINLQYTREAHLKCSHRLNTIAKWVGWFQIGLSAISTAGLISVLIKDNSMGTIVGTVCSACLFAISTYIKDKDLKTESRKHIETAEKLFSMREKYRLLLSTFNCKTQEKIENLIKTYVNETELIYKDAPSYEEIDYKKACKATIFGQSGGGGKVCALMGMPSAKGTFQRAIIQSGGFLAVSNDRSAATTKEFLDYIGIDKEHIDDLQKYPPDELIRIMREINAPRDPSSLDNFCVFLAVWDGEIVKYNPFDGAEGSEYSKDIYVINGGPKDDSLLNALMNPKVFDYSFEDVAKAITEFGYTPEQAGKIIEIYKEMLKDEVKGEIQPIDVYGAFTNDQTGLKNNILWYRSRAKVGAAPFYNYVFAFEGPFSDTKAIHGVDVPFFFDNGKYATGIWTADTYVDAMKCSDACGAAWAAFARTGDPSCPQIGVWKPFDEEHYYTMVFNTDSKLVSDYRSPGRKIAFGEI